MKNVNYLRGYLVNELKVEQAKEGDPIKVAVEVMKAMRAAYAQVCDALNVATGHPEEVGKVGSAKAGFPQGFTVEDNR